MVHNLSDNCLKCQKTEAMEKANYHLSSSATPFISLHLRMSRSLNAILFYREAYTDDFT